MSEKPSKYTVDITLSAQEYQITMTLEDGFEFGRASGFYNKNVDVIRALINLMTYVSNLDTVCTMPSTIV